MMKTVIVGLLLTVGIISAAPPDCLQTYRFTNRASDTTAFAGQQLITTIPGSTQTYDNRNQGCTSWSVSYDNEGFSALSIQFQSAPVSFSTPNFNAGTFAAFAGTAVTGANPMTATTSNFYTGTGYYPFLNIILTSATGTGSINVTLQGWRSSVFLLAGAVTKGANTFTGTQTAPTFSGTTVTGTNIQATTKYIWSAGSSMQAPSDGIIELTKNGLADFVRIQMGGTTSSFGAIGQTTGANPLISIQAADGTGVADLGIVNIKSTTGQRYVCVDTAGKLVSSASACSGT